MDPRLNEKLSKWHNAISEIETAERAFLTLEANEKPMWSSLFLAAEGKTVSDRESKAYSSELWSDFSKGLVEAKVGYNKQKRLLELRQASFQSEYLSAKREAEVIQKYPKEGGF